MNTDSFAIHHLDMQGKHIEKLQAENRLLTQFMNYIINSVRNSGPEGFTVTPERMETLMEDYYGKIGRIRFGLAGGETDE